MGFCCVCCASAASSPHAALPWVLSSAASRTEKLCNHTHLQKKPKTPSAPQGENLPGARCLCAPAEISTLWRHLGCWMGSAAVTLCPAVVAHVGTYRGKPAGCLQCQGRCGAPNSLWVSVLWYHSSGVQGLCSSLCPRPFPAAPASSHGVFAMLDGAHLADRQGGIILSGSVPKEESEGTDVASCSQLRWLLLLSCCPWLAGFADPCPGHRWMQELPSALSSVWLL